MGKKWKYINCVLLILFLCVGAGSQRCVFAQMKEVELKFIETSDIHGNYLSYDYINQCDANGGLSRIYTYVIQERKKHGPNLLLFDNGDMIEGQPISYYYNYVDTLSPHIGADIMNYMRYDVGCLGNHEIETGIPVMDRWINQCDFPILTANIVWESDGTPYVKPYTVFEREGLRIAVLGLSTAATPAWVCKSMWNGLEFHDMEESARKWMSIIREKEKPDIVVGLFHSGKDARLIANRYKDDVSLEVAQRVPGFDAVLIGHDHTLYCEKIVNVAGDSVLVVNPGSSGLVIADVTMSLTINAGKVVKKKIKGELIDTEAYEPDKKMMERYASHHKDVNDYVLQKIGVFTETVTTRPAYFGPSAFVDFIHSLQLHISGADISFASPLSFDTRIEGGDIRISDMFRLYRYKNLIYTMSLSGREIKNYLEESYSLWTNQMKSPEDNLLLLTNNGKSKTLFTNLYYYFDSAAGIIYMVDVTKPKGEKISILCMSDGKPFDMDKMYSVALTSYRGNGGGDLLTRGAGLSIDELDDRILNITDNDFRYYLIEYIKQNKVIHPRVLNHWKFVPEPWVRIATERDYSYLFGGGNKTNE